MDLEDIRGKILSVILLMILCMNTIFWSIIGGILSIFERKGNLAHICNRNWAKLNLIIGGYKVEFEGMENIDPSMVYVIVANHQSLFDIVMLLGLLPIQFRFVSRKEIFRIPFLGWAMRFARYIELDRKSLKGAMKAFSECVRTLRDGISVMIFPEGTRSKDGRVQGFRRGPFQLAIASRVPVLPVTILGTARAISPNGLRIVPCRVKMIVSRPIDWKAYGAKKDRMLMEDARRAIEDQFNRFCRNYYPFNQEI